MKQKKLSKAVVYPEWMKGLGFDDLERCPQCRNIERFKAKCEGCEGMGFIKLKEKSVSLWDIK